MTAPGATRLRRDLGTVESYAALIGILVGAGIYRVTRDASVITGPSVILGHLVLAIVVLASSVPYAVYLSTPLGREPGGEYSHIAHTFRAPGAAFVGAWLKIISYVGATAFLAVVLADYTLELAVQLTGIDADQCAGMQIPVALVSVAFFGLVHALGVRWFGRIQVAMCALLGISILVLVVPGLLAIDSANYRPFFTGGTSGFLSSLPTLFFAYAGFEAVAQTAGEVRDSTDRLPRVFLRGIGATAVIFLAMSCVLVGVLPISELKASKAPMASAAAVYLPAGAIALVTLGGVLAAATSLNATMIVPPRLGFILARDGMLPPWLGRLHAGTGTPVVGLLATTALAALLLLSGQPQLGLNLAVLALLMLYGFHSLALLLLPRLAPALYAQVGVRVPRTLQCAAATLSLVAMTALVVVQLTRDVTKIGETTLVGRFSTGTLTGLELCCAWALLGWLVLRRRSRQTA